MKGDTANEREREREREREKEREREREENSCRIMNYFFYLSAQRNTNLYNYGKKKKSSPTNPDHSCERIIT